MSLLFPLKLYALIMVVNIRHPNSQLNSSNEL